MINRGQGDKNISLPKAGGAGDRMGQFYVKEKCICRVEWETAGANDFSATCILIILISCAQGSFEEQEEVCSSTPA